MQAKEFEREALHDLLAALQAAYKEIGKLEAEVSELRRKLTAR